MDAFPDIARLVPQRGASCLLDAVLSADETGVECRATLPADHPYMTKTGVHPLVAIELFAQAAAVHRALAGGVEAMAGAEPESGLLAAAQVDTIADCLAAGSRLVVRVTPDATLAGLMRFVGELFADGAERRLLASGSVSVKVGSWPEASSSGSSQ